MNFKQYVKTRFPRFFVFARDLKDQINIEINTLRQVGITRILKQLIGSKEKWRKELPLQGIRQVSLPIFSLAEAKETTADYKEGGHTFYFPPKSIKNSPLGDILKNYPKDTGVKIVKRQGGVSQPFVSADKTCRAQTLFSPSHTDLLLVYNLFYALGIGPRLYDVIELSFQNGDKHVAYLLEHIDGKCSSHQDCERFIVGLKKLESEKLIKLVNWNGFQDMDFIL